MFVDGYISVEYIITRKKVKLIINGVRSQTDLIKSANFLITCLATLCFLYNAMTSLRSSLAVMSTTINTHRIKKVGPVVIFFF